MTVAFKANLNGTNQSFSPGVTTQVIFTNEVYDSGGYFASSAWTPPAGYISLSVTLTIGASTTKPNSNWSMAVVYKNGAYLSQLNMSTIQFATDTICGTVQDQCNGTDAYTMLGWIENAGAAGTYFDGNTYATNFSGIWYPP